ncbi:hypothetical protein F511_29182 [Dorcoceras hygrometricum]|uniref:Uncharacterized protein n=1 Tax=Dorcoceras hygrometricum TaxID=472368 RepID=A0A2Z7DJK7_9LAMI|nr:hypothetical protein F511_29182 [Dorcoceras hygrometricum]
MSSFKNPLPDILDSNKFTGLNYQDWLRNLNLVLASEKLLYTIEKCPPKTAPADISPEELVTLKQWWDDEVKARCYVCFSVVALRAKTTAFRLVGATSFGCCVWYQLIAVDTTPIRSTTRTETPPSGCTRNTDEFCTNGFSRRVGRKQISGDNGRRRRRRTAAAATA